MLLVGVLPFVAFGLGFSVAVFMYTFLGDVIFGMFGKCAHFVIMNRVVSAVGQTGECTITVHAASQAFPASQASHALHVSGQTRHGRQCNAGGKHFLGPGPERERSTYR